MRARFFESQHVSLEGETRNRSGEGGIEVADMTLMTDDIEWYPLPEVDDIHDGIMASSSHGTTASASSTAPSLSYLTPASSVGGFKHRSRQMTENNPYITGTVQPYLRKPPKTGNSRMGTTSSQTHKGGLVSAVESFWLQRKSTPSASSFSTAWSIPRGESSVRQATLSLSRKTSSSVSFKTAKSASVPALEPMRQLTVGENLQTITSEKPRLTPVVVTVSSSASGDQQDLDEKNSNTESLSTQSSSAAGNTTSEAAAAHDQRLSTASSKVDLRPSTAGPQLDTSITSSVLTASTPPTRAKSHSSSGVLAAGGVRMNQETQTSAVSPTTLNHLWSQFLAGHLRGGESNTTTKHSPSVAYSETGVQTTPSLGTNKFPSHPVLSPEVEQTPPPTRFSQLTLQESLKTLRPDFVHRSEQRQRELRRNRDLRNRAHCRAATELLHHPHTRPATARERGKSGRSPHFVLIDVTRNRPKMSPVEMYRNSQKYWSKLPEVRQKEQETRRESQAATNRLRMKLYEEKVLERLRKQRK